MTKALTMTWIPPADPVAGIRADHERRIQIISMELDGKTNSYNNELRFSPSTAQRQWKDQQSVDEYINFMCKLANKYGGTVVVGETIDL